MRNKGSRNQITTFVFIYLFIYFLAVTKILLWLFVIFLVVCFVLNCIHLGYYCALPSAALYESFIPVVQHSLK